MEITQLTPSRCQIRSLRTRPRVTQHWSQSLWSVVMKPRRELPWPQPRPIRHLPAPRPLLPKASPAPDPLYNPDLARWGPSRAASRVWPCLSQVHWRYGRRLSPPGGRAPSAGAHGPQSNSPLGTGGHRAVPTGGPVHDAGVSVKAPVSAWG
ncbi:hypothetical protein HJG60_008958 [Phyllostomus discolor]|uniref:Uncharacterized protein n=1 Tax=Phyllostomus discolor TaxID=89673 RepID=A0A833YTR8_9CHIR|nr:hypothetical protein HJG60_008958 [Phyllostomus discolor]